MKKCVLFFVVFVASAFAAQSADAKIARPKVIWAKVGTDSAAMENDFTACGQSTKGVVMPGDGPPDVQGVGPVGSALGSWLWSALEQPRIRDHAIRMCMLNRGYHGIRLTPDEAAELKLQTSPATAAQWAEQFYRRPDFGKRLAFDSPPPLPEAVEEAYAFGAVRLDAASLVAASETVGVRGVILSGAAVHRKTARNLVDAYSDLNSGGYFAAGAVMQQAVFSEKDGTRHTFWCGIYTSTMEKTPACARNDSGGYVIDQPEGARWITTGLDLHGEPGLADPESFHLDVSDVDLLGPMSFTLSIRKLTNDAITLEAVVNHDGDGETVWRKSAPISADGSVTIPFWTHRLVLTRTEKGVAVAFPADGNGVGLH